MELGDATIFSVIKKRLAWLTRRQEVLGQNIANSDTPDYKPRDLKPFNFKELLSRRAHQVNMAVTDKSHISPPQQAGIRIFHGQGPQALRDGARRKRRHPRRTDGQGQPDRHLSPTDHRALQQASRHDENRPRQRKINNG